MTTGLQVSLLGGFTCCTVEGVELRFPTRKVQALLGFLAADAGQRHGRGKLAGLFWDDMPEDRARANLRKTLSRLQSSLPEAARRVLVVDSHGIGLDAGLAVDLELFQRLVADGTPETLERALALYRGPFLDGLDGCGEAFDEWLATERRRVEETLQQLLHRLLDHYVVTGAIDAAIQLALKLLAIDSLDEDVHRTLIRLYMYQDRVGAALDQYRRCRELLAGELGVDPAPETERLKDDLRSLVPPGYGTPEPPVPESDDVPERVSVIETAAAFRGRRRTDPDGHPSIAVLVFDVEEEASPHLHLVQGMAEDIATGIGCFRELTVIAPATMLAYRRAAMPPEAIGTELGVDYVLAGSLRRRGDRARISARLLESTSARQVWGERYDCILDEIFDVQDDVVARIVGSLCGSVEADRLDLARRKRPEDWQTHDLWLRGWSALRRPELAAIHEARRCFQQAVARDPNYARAYVGLALAHLNEWACYTWNHWVFLQQEALALARKAVTLDERDHRARCMLALAELYAGRYDPAGRELEMALALNPNDADVLAHASFALALIGQPDNGAEAARKALRLAPHRPDWYAGMAGVALFSARCYQEAIDVMACAPEAFCNTPAFIAACHAHLGEPGRAAAYRDTVYRHYRYHIGRGLFPRRYTCIDWLMALDPYRNGEDAEHYAEGLRKAGFD